MLKVLSLRDDQLDTMRAECRVSGQDFYNYVASKVLEKPYAEVSGQERSGIKNLLFAYMYGSRHPFKHPLLTLGAWEADGKDWVRRNSENGVVLRVSPSGSVWTWEVPPAIFDTTTRTEINSGTDTTVEGAKAQADYAGRSFGFSA